VEISTLGYRAELIGSAALVMESRTKEQIRLHHKGKKHKDLIPA
jgi:hypothetical protein